MAIAWLHSSHGYVVPHMETVSAVVLDKVMPGDYLKRTDRGFVRCKCYEAEAMAYRQASARSTTEIVTLRKDAT